jgi:hypothetical protein
MNSEDINRMWLQSQDDAEGMRLGFTTQQHYFAALVADAEAKRIHNEGMVTVGHMREQIAAEREACAEICESKKSMAASYFEINEYLQECADEIRERSAE